MITSHIRLNLEEGRWVASQTVSKIMSSWSHIVLVWATKKLSLCDCTRLKLSATWHFIKEIKPLFSEARSKILQRSCQRQLAVITARSIPQVTSRWYLASRGASGLVVTLSTLIVLFQTLEFVTSPSSVYVWTYVQTARRIDTENDCHESWTRTLQAQTWTRCWLWESLQNKGNTDDMNKLCRVKVQIYKTKKIKKYN